MTDDLSRPFVAPTPVRGGPIELAYLIAEARAIKRAYTGPGCACRQSGWYIEGGRWVECRRCSRGRRAA